MSVVVVIPARLNSSRLPGKLLLQETGQPLLQYAWEAATQAKSPSQVVIATDSLEIYQAASACGAACEMTGEHTSGTDRAAEVIRRRFPDCEFVVNLQGDEPELDPAHIDLLVTTLQQHPSAQMATLTTPIECGEELNDPSCVKAVVTTNGVATYFSRAAVPFARDVDPEAIIAEGSPYKRHVGLYAFRRNFLLRFAQTPPSPLEQIERLEQLRALEMGAQIAVAEVTDSAVGIDTPADYARFVARQRRAA